MAAAGVGSEAATFIELLRGGVLLPEAHEDQRDLTGTEFRDGDIHESASDALSAGRGGHGKRFESSGLFDRRPDRQVAGSDLNTGIAHKLIEELGDDNEGSAVTAHRCGETH